VTNVENFNNKYANKLRGWGVSLDEFASKLSKVKSSAKRDFEAGVVELHAAVDKATNVERNNRLKWDDLKSRVRLSWRVLFGKSRRGKRGNRVVV
jgi:hypothetical protein